jgi:hypothetical protein
VSVPALSLGWPMSTCGVRTCRDPECFARAAWRAYHSERTVRATLGGLADLAGWKWLMLGAAALLLPALVLQAARKAPRS